MEKQSCDYYSREELGCSDMCLGWKKQFPGHGVYEVCSCRGRGWTNPWSSWLVSAVWHRGRHCWEEGRAEPQDGVSTRIGKVSWLHCRSLHLETSKCENLIYRGPPTPLQILHSENFWRHLTIWNWGWWWCSISADNDLAWSEDVWNLLTSSDPYGKVSTMAMDAGLI